MTVEPTESRGTATSAGGRDRGGLALDGTNASVHAELVRLVAELERIAASDPSDAQAEAVVGAIAKLLPDERAADLLDEIVGADVPSPLRASAAFYLVRAGLLDTDAPVVHRLLSEVGPPARLAMARGLHESGDHHRARGMLAPLVRAVHREVRYEAQLWYRYDPIEYSSMPTLDLIGDATREPGWLHRSWAAMELVNRGEIDTALDALEGVVGIWAGPREDGAGTTEPLDTIEMLGGLTFHPRAIALLNRAADDPNPEIREAARRELDAVDTSRVIDLAAEERREAEQRAHDEGFRRFGTLRGKR